MYPVIPSGDIVKDLYILGAWTAGKTDFRKGRGIVIAMGLDRYREGHRVFIISTHGNIQVTVSIFAQPHIYCSISYSDVAELEGVPRFREPQRQQRHPRRSVAPS